MTAAALAARSRGRRRPSTTSAAAEARPHASPTTTTAPPSRSPPQMCSPPPTAPPPRLSRLSPPLPPLLLLLLLGCLLPHGALAQVAVPKGIVTPIWQCPSGSDIVAGKLTAYQTFCAQEFAVCMANPELTVGGPYTALTVRALTCTWCYADAWACYSDCPRPGFPLQWQQSCTQLCSPDLAYVCSGDKPPA
jgi:hypothetical protein